MVCSIQYQVFGTLMYVATKSSYNAYFNQVLWSCIFQQHIYNICINQIILQSMFQSRVFTMYVSIKYVSIKYVDDGCFNQVCLRYIFRARQCIHSLSQSIKLHSDTVLKLKFWFCIVESDNEYQCWDNYLNHCIPNMVP